jgi:fibronectin type 3 domain-containing protein
MLLSKDSILSFNDTLPLTAEPAVYSYAVASENTSYNISPMTERVSLQYSGGMLPVPSKVDVMLLGKSVFVTWKNVSEQNAAVSAYYIFRSLVDENNKSVGSKRIAINSYKENSYTDATVVEGKHYRYSIQCVGIDSTDLGSISAIAGIDIPELLPAQPGSVTAYGSDKKIVIHWDVPADNSITGFRIYRAVANQEATLLKQLPADADQFEDTAVTENQVYYYYIRSVNNIGKESKPTDEVSAKAK